MKGKNQPTGRQAVKKAIYSRNARTAVLDLAWKTIENALNDPKVDEKEKRMIALELVKKSIPQGHEHSGDMKFEWAIIDG